MSGHTTYQYRNTNLYYHLFTLLWRYECKQFCLYIIHNSEWHFLNKDNTTLAPIQRTYLVGEYRSADILTFKDIAMLRV